MSDQVAVTVLILDDEGPCDFCFNNHLLFDPPYRACSEHFEKAKAAIEGDSIPTAEIDLDDA